MHTNIEIETKVVEEMQDDTVAASYYALGFDAGMEAALHVLNEPKIVRDRGKGTRVFCPTCHADLSVGEVAGCRNAYERCPECGQVLDWAA